MVYLQPTSGSCIEASPLPPFSQDLGLNHHLNYSLPSGTHLQSITITYGGVQYYNWYCSLIMPSPLNLLLGPLNCNGNTNTMINLQGGPSSPPPYSYEFKLTTH